jgi:pilus assembly protein Flp/PilA
MLEMIMTYVRATFPSLHEREEGQALVEYALILALVSIVAIAGLEAIGTNVLAKLNDVAAELA